ncbi:MAG: cobalamin-binding protein [Candidatus Omnitrophica bacterium]|nr:cobalamin-binding protein [Candidatus Omnitrophota bacterium]
MRIVSLIASGTEIVCALGFEAALVGRSHECDHPPAVLRLPACSEPKFNVEGSSREIDERVKTIVRESLSVYRIDAEKLKNLRPQVIITQDHCEVCAVSLKDVEQAVCSWLGPEVKIAALRPNALADIWQNFRQVAEVLGCPSKAQELIDQCLPRMSAVQKRTGSLPRPSVACIEWIEPLMCAGNWVPELVAMAGGRDLLGKPGAHSPWMQWDQLRQADPDIIIVMPCGWDIGRTRREMPVLTKQEGWHQLKAVCSNKVYLADGNQYFNRPGPRLVESLEILAEIIHPQAFSFGHYRKGWQRLLA